MLQANPTKNGTGVLILGDYGDLSALYETIHHIANTLKEEDAIQKAHNQLLMNFSYEIRKAYSGQRLIEKLTYDNDNTELKYNGFQIVWTDLLIFISVLRSNAGYVHTDKFHQANLYLLEYLTEKTLFEYDAEGANAIKDYIGGRINITNEYAFIIYQAIHINFVTEKPGKNRFRKIPALLSAHFSESSEQYKELIESFRQSADATNCKITDLEFSEFPEIVW